MSDKKDQHHVFFRAIHLLCTQVSALLKLLYFPKTLSTPLLPKALTYTSSSVSKGPVSPD